VVKPTYVAIVQRDRPDVIESLRRMQASDIRLLADRRQAARRTGPARRATPPAAPERRRRERRLPPPATWETQGFIVVAVPAPEE
jgi:hypothetical protein